MDTVLFFKLEQILSICSKTKTPHIKIGSQYSTTILKAANKRRGSFQLKKFKNLPKGSYLTQKKKAFVLSNVRLVL